MQQFLREDAKYRALKLVAGQHRIYKQEEDGGVGDDWCVMVASSHVRSMMFLAKVLKEEGVCMCVCFSYK